jgi:hypothetical protein
MKIEFEIEEKIPDIVAEILYSGKWRSAITAECRGLKRAVIRNFMQDVVAFVEIWEHELHIKTACCNATCRIFGRNGRMMCEYVGAGACCRLPDKRVFPQLTPLRNIHHYLAGHEEPEASFEQPRTPRPADRGPIGRRYDEFIHEHLPVSPHLKNEG